MAFFTLRRFNLVGRAHLQVGLPKGLASVLDGGIPHISRFVLGQVVLLGSKHRARSGNSDPTYEGLSTDLEVLHAVKTNESSCASQASLAMDSNGTSFRVSEVLLTRSDELIDDFRGRSRTIHENHVIVCNAHAFELCLVILGIVKAYHSCHIQVLENLSVAGGRVSITRLLTLISVDGSHESNELSRDNPIQVSVLDFFVVLIFTSIKLVVLVPAKFDS